MFFQYRTFALYIAGRAPSMHKNLCLPNHDLALFKAFLKAKGYLFVEVTHCRHRQVTQIAYAKPGSTVHLTCYENGLLNESFLVEGDKHVLGIWERANRKYQP